MTYVNPTAPGTSAGTTASNPATGSSATGLNQLDNSQTFLDLLVAQLKNQNPDNPTNPTSFMTEIAQLTAVQSQTSLNAEEQTVAADSMLGRSVSGNGANGQPIAGTVTGVVLSSSGPPELQLSPAAGTTTPTTLALDQVTRVYGGVTAATGSTAGTASSGSASPGSTTATSNSSTGA